MSDDNPSIISHISVGTNDFARATAFYEVVLAHAKQLPTEVMTLFLQDAAVALKVIASDGSTYPLKSSVPAENRSDLSDPPTQQTPRQIDETEHVTPEPAAGDRHRPGYGANNPARNLNLCRSEPHFTRSKNRYA